MLGLQFKLENGREVIAVYDSSDSCHRCDLFTKDTLGRENCIQSIDCSVENIVFKYITTKICIRP